MNKPESSVQLAASSRSSIVKVGGSLGMAATFIALGAFLFALCGFGTDFTFAYLAALLALVGMVVTVVGATMRSYTGPEDTQPLAAFFVSLMGLIAATAEMMFSVHPMK